MTTQEIADRLVTLCRQGKNEKAYRELFAKNAVAIEPEHTRAPNAEGLDALLKKNKEFEAGIEEMHSATVSDPLVADNYFSVVMGLDATFKERDRVNMNEVCVYKVEDGKIVSEQFFY